ncbi:hypothetical protein V6N13_126573 [Hibiscus sabdariffa]
MLLQEESIWLKKSRCNWMIIGDRNTKFYHAFASSRHRANKVKGLHKDNGEWCTNPSVLCALASGFYSSLFTSDGANSSSYHIHGFFPRVEARQLDSLLAPIMDEEIATIMPPLRSSAMDVPGWKWTGNRSFIVKSIYHARRNDHDLVHDPIWKRISKFQRPMRIKTLLWLLAHGTYMFSSLIRSMHDLGGYQARIATIMPPLRSSAMDVPGWKWTGNRSFIVKSIYHARRNDHDLVHDPI